MLSNKLTFSLTSLVFLLIASLCLPIVAEAQVNWLVPPHAAADLNGDNDTADPGEGAGVISAGAFAVYAVGADADTSEIESPARTTYATSDLATLNDMFQSDWMIEVIADESLNLDPKELVISEIGWGLNESGTDPAGMQASIFVEFYNASGREITIGTNELYVLVSSFPTELPTNYLNVTGAANAATPTALEVRLSAYAYGSGMFTNRVNAADPDKGKAITEDRDHSHVVVDRISNVEFDDLGIKGRYTFPGQNGRLAVQTAPDAFPQVPIISASRKINYDAAKAVDGVPNGHEAGSWEETDPFARRNVGTSYLIANPGDGLDPTDYARAAATTAPPANSLVINEVRNAEGSDLDWIEIKNISDPSEDDSEVQLKDWELNVYAGGKKNGAPDGEKTLVVFPEYELGAQEILLIVNRDPGETELAGGVNLDILLDANADQLQKGAQHLYIISDALDLPDGGDFLLLLRNALDKDNTHEAIQDAAGSNETTGYDNDRDSRTQVLPFKNYLKMGDDKVGAFASDGNHSAWARIPKGIEAGNYGIENANGRHKGAWEKVTGADTHGLGYDREVDLDTAPGTPGYENMIADTVDDFDTTDPDPDGMEIASNLISISEVMYDAGPRWNLVQWIELYNQSMTQAVNIAGWELEIRNATDAVESYVDSSFIFEDAVILPNQTLLIVSGPGANDVPDNRVYNLFEHHRRELGLTTRGSVLLSPDGFYLKLTDKADIDNDSREDEDMVVDEAGNVMVDGASRIVEWELPARGDVRQSLVRQYGTSKLDGTSDPASDGTVVESWIQSDLTGAGLAYFGHRDDVGTPGYRLGGPLPVSLASFRPVRDKATGQVVITWVTESELNNAGFNILRAESKDGEFQVINLTGIIAGHGTTSEKHVYSYTDKTAKPNVAYYYQIEDVSLDGHRTTLQTTHMRGNVNASGKLTTTWSNLKLQK